MYCGAAKDTPRKLTQKNTRPKKTHIKTGAFSLLPFLTESAKQFTAEKREQRQKGVAFLRRYSIRP